MDEHEATAYAAEMNFQLWKEELARRETCEAECLELNAALEKVRRLCIAAHDLEMHQLREHIARIAAAVGLAARSR